MALKRKGTVTDNIIREIEGLYDRVKIKMK